MSQTPFPPGVPISPRDSAAGWFDPVVAAPAAEPSPAAGNDALSPGRPSTYSQPTTWHEVSWVGFAGDTDMPDETPAAPQALTASPPSAADSGTGDAAAGQGASRAETGILRIGPAGPPAS